MMDIKLFSTQRKPDLKCSVRKIIWALSSK